MSEKESVTLEIPKGLMRFLADYKPCLGCDTVKEYLEDAVIDRVVADLEASTFDPTVKQIAEKYDLKKEFGVSS